MEDMVRAVREEKDTRKRLDLAEELIRYFSNEDCDYQEFTDYASLFAGLATWIRAASIQVSVAAMRVLGVMGTVMKTDFQVYLNTIYDPVMERLGDQKEMAREAAQLLLHQLMKDCVSSPQALLDRLMEVCLVHKNWRVKEQGLICLTKTLSYFGAGEIVVSRHVEAICALLSDANNSVRAAAMETLVDIYRHVGRKLRTDLSKRDIPTAKMKVLSERFNEVDVSTHSENHCSEMEEDQSDTNEGIRGWMGASVEDTGRRRPPASEAGTARHAHHPRPHSSAGSRLGRMGQSAGTLTTSSTSTSSSGAVDEDDFRRAFADTPEESFRNKRELEKKLQDVAAILKNSDKSWGLRVNALKEFRGMVHLNQSVVPQEAYTALLKDVQDCMIISLKDLRSQIIREACVTVSHICTVLRHSAAGFGAEMLPPLILLLPNSAKVMSSSAEVCVQFIIKYSPSATLLQHLASQGFSSKSNVVRRCCAEFLLQCMTSFETSHLLKQVSVVENLLTAAIRDADATARKSGRKAYWRYHTHFPSNAARFMETFSRQEQKYINDERSPPGDSRESADLSAMTRSLGAATLRDNHYGSPPSPAHNPTVRVIRPTVRKGQSAKSLRPASSMENISNTETSGRVSPTPTNSKSKSSTSSRTSGNVNRPSSRAGVQRPSSRTSVLRPSSRSSMRPERASERSVTKTLPRLSRSAQPSPSHSRETSPSGSGHHGHTLSGRNRKIAPLTADSLLKLCGNSVSKKQDDDDDVASVSSDRSALSYSSEMSINPYTKFTHPIEDLNELIAMCSSSQWAERRDGIAQLHMLLESSRTFSHGDMEKIKAVFKRMFQEPHAKVYSMFLDTLSKFITEYREQLEDWLFLLLLRLLQRSGTDMLSSVLFKLQMVLENIRNSFEADSQLVALFRIINDPTQTLNTKVKLAYLEYLLELIPMLEPGHFKETQDSRGAVCKVVKFTTEPKSADIRKLSQKTIIALFDLNTATFSLIQRSLTKSDQDSANKILKTYIMSELPSSGDESDKEMNTTSPRRTASGTKGTSSKTPRVSKLDSTPTLPPSGHRGLKGARTISSSSPNMYGPNVAMSLPVGSARQNRIRPPGSSGRTTPSMIPTPKKTGPRRPMSTTPGSSPATPRFKKESTTPTRSASVGPEKLASQLAARRSGKHMHSMQDSIAARRLPRPSSARSDYSISRYQNGGDEEEESEDFRSRPSDFSLSDLPSLDFDSPDEDEGAFEHKSDHVRLVEKKLTQEDPREWQTGLQTLYALLHDFQGQFKWEDHFKTVFLRLMVILDDPDSTQKVLVLRIVREILKADGHFVKDYAEMTTMKVLKCYANQDALISQAAEDIFPLLAPVIAADCAIPLLTPLLLSETHPMLLGIMKFLLKVIQEPIEESYLRGKLCDVVPAITRGYCHSESSVRKASVFCLVAVYRIVGEDMKTHLPKLSSSQKKLLDMYIKKDDGVASSVAARSSGAAPKSPGATPHVSGSPSFSSSPHRVRP